MKLVRDGQIVAPYCSECGCRLGYQIIGHITILEHFRHPQWEWGKDAREHPCSQWNNEWEVESNKVYFAQ